MVITNYLSIFVDGLKLILVYGIVHDLFEMIH